MSHTRIERLIMYDLLGRKDWETFSLSSLATRLDIDYKWCRCAVLKLESEGLLRTERLRGRELLISLRGPMPKPTIKDINPYMGSVFGKNKPMTYNQQYGESMNKIIQELRETISNPTYPRPEVTTEEKEKLAKRARQLAAIRDDSLRLAYFMAVCVENARLLREVNEHRQARGFELLPVYDPDSKHE